MVSCQQIAVQRITWNILYQHNLGVWVKDQANFCEWPAAWKMLLTSKLFKRNHQFANFTQTHSADTWTRPITIDNEGSVFFWPDAGLVRLSGRIVGIRKIPFFGAATTTRSWSPGFWSLGNCPQSDCIQRKLTDSKKISFLIQSVSQILANLFLELILVFGTNYLHYANDTAQKNIAESKNGHLTQGDVLSGWATIFYADHISPLFVFRGPNFS